jgi:DNA-binding NarL/FixJ family response regulator
VCVRTPLAAQNVASAAARLGLTAAVRTAVSDPEVMLRLAERPADVVLADTALTRPDSAGFTRRVLARAPGAALLLFGAEEPVVASAAIAAGARGLIQGGDHDLVSVVAKAMLLLAAPGRAVRGPGRDGAKLAGAGQPRPAEVGGPTGRTAGDQRAGAASRAPTRPGAVAPDEAAGTGAAGGGGGAGGGAGGAGAGAAGQPVVPVQRGEDVTGDAEPATPNLDPAAPSADPPVPGGPAAPSGSRANATPDARFGGPRRADPVNASGYGRNGRGPGGSARQVALTEREMQVLLGMADGKSNAEIGRELFVSEDTVKTHARRLFRKLGARDRAHAVAAGFRAGLVA